MEKKLLKSSNYFNAIPESLELLFKKIELEKYEELYEIEKNDTASLQDTLKAVLKALEHKNKTISHLRYMWMALILSISTQPTLEYVDSNNSLPKISISIISRSIIIILVTFLCEKQKGRTIEINPDNLDKLIQEVFELHVSYLHNEEANFQAISEALDVFYNAMRVINYDYSVEAILEILYDCLEGYAIFPGSYGRRELFNWWLLDVVPASYNLQPTKSFYVVEGVEHKEEIKLYQTRLLEKIIEQICLNLSSQISPDEASFYIQQSNDIYGSIQISSKQIDNILRKSKFDVKINSINYNYKR